MRLVQYQKEEEDILNRVAKQHGIEPEKLWEMYLQVMNSNYEQDLWDIASENLEELKGEEQ